MSTSTMSERNMTSIHPGRRKSRIPYIFFAFFGIVFLMNGVMIWFALDSWTGLKSDQPYIRGLDYNRTLDAVEAQKALGWSVDLARRVEGGALILTVAVLDRAGAPIRGAEVMVELLRPTHAGIDHTGTAVEVAPGRYEYRIATPLPGQWDVRQTALSGGESFVQVERIFVDPDALEGAGK